MTAPFGKVPSWVGQDNCPLHGAVEYGLIAILAARRAVRRKRFFYKGAEVILEPGHVCVSQRDLAEKLAVDRQRIRTGIKNLQKLQILNPPNNPSPNPKNGPAPQVFFFNVDMQLDAFGALRKPVNQPKEQPKEQPPVNPVETQQKPTSIDDKMIRGLEGSNAPAREADSATQNPPPGKPDPKKFGMTESWAMDRDVEDRLEARFKLDLGSEGFWRQVERFVDYHRELGTVDSQTGFERSLENWLKRADANREEPPKINGKPAPKNGNSIDLAPGFDIGDFGERVVAEYRKSLREAGEPRMTERQARKVKSEAMSMKIGKADQVGIDGADPWSTDEVLQRLGLTKGCAA